MHLEDKGAEDEKARLTSTQPHARLSSIPPPKNRIPIRDEFGNMTNRADLSIRYMAQTKPLAPHGLWDTGDEMDKEPFDEEGDVREAPDSNPITSPDGLVLIQPFHYGPKDRERILAKILAKREQREEPR